jgi:hypothetical protein
MTSCFFWAMADPADRVIAATAKANSVVFTGFICPSHILKRTFIRPVSKLGLSLCPLPGRLVQSTSVDVQMPWNVLTARNISASRAGKIKKLRNRLV